MGKLKTTYPIDITIEFFLFLENNQLIRDTYAVKLQSGNLTYLLVDAKFEEFLLNSDIRYEAYMFFIPLKTEEQELLMQKDWVLNINEIEERGRYIMIRVKSHTQHIKEIIYEELATLNKRINQIEQKIKDSFEPNQENQKRIVNPAPMLHHANSILPILPDKDLDIGILFSEPIVDEKGKEASFPVDFRSQIQRLYSALNNSYKPQITVECQIGTKQHLKHLIGIKKPKILHIICHGTKEGELQFEDDSKFSIGLLNSIDSQKIRQILMSQKESIPKLVYINSCHSQTIGKIFFEAGAQFVVMIDSQDKIDDEAAQIFSQNFYRNIFRGEKVGFSFKQAKDTVGMKHNSFGCCCRHTSREKHRVNCRWLKIVEQIGEHEAHQLYHIPSDKCTCPLRNHNRHSLTCQWARFSLFHINNDFRIKSPTGEQYFPKKVAELPAYLPYQKKELMICCCFNFEGQFKEPRIPHSQSNKFKMLSCCDEETQPLYILQKNVNFRTQIIDYTAPELTEYHEKVQNSAVLGRQQQLYEFMKKIRDQKLYIFFLYGPSGIGKTSFAIKTATYLIERRVYEIYFFIDLYNIKDRDMFRNKFNEVTQFGYPNNRNSLNEIRGKPMIIILDNCDQFFLQSTMDFQEEILNLRKEFLHTKLLMTCQEKNLSTLENSIIITHHQSYKRQLKLLSQNVAAKALFSKIKNYLDISVNFLDVRGLIQKKKQLQIPKVIQNLSHTFSNIKGKIKIKDLIEKINQCDKGKGDLLFHKLVQENLNMLKIKCWESYQMLIFLSQFSQGIDRKDFNILSMYDKATQLTNRQNQAIIDIPIDKHWKKRLAILFERYKETQASQITKDSEGEEAANSSPLFIQKQVSYIQNKKVEQNHLSNKDMLENHPMFRRQSYFLQELSKNRFIVKRFIRDFIWNKDNSDENYYMKHIFVAYTSVMLDIYLKFLVEEYYVHEEVMEYTDISKAGIFKYKDNNYINISLTESLRYAEDYNTKFEKILKQQDTLNQKIKSSDPSVFILNHKLDFLHIYGYDWIKVYDYLKLNKKRQANVFITYLQKLIILIPTALKIANVEESLLQYSIRQSIQLHSQIRNYSKPQHNLMLTIKLKLMKSGSELLKNPQDQSIIPNIQFQKHFHKNDLEKISPQLLNVVQSMFRLEIQILQIYRQYEKVKDIKKSGEMSRNVGQIILQKMKKLQEWINTQQDWMVSQACEVLHAKKYLLMAMIYNKLLEVPGKHITNMNIIAFKNKYTSTFIHYASEAARIFIPNNMIKLGFRAKLLELNMVWEASKLRIKTNQLTRQGQNIRFLLKQVEEIYLNTSNNLIGLTFFETLIKKIKKQMKEKMWQESINSLIFLKAVPLSHKNNPLIQNIVRKHNSVKDQFRAMFKNSEIDLSVKFQILSSEKLQQEAKKGSTILLLLADAKIQYQKDTFGRNIQKSCKIFLILQGNDLREQEVQINNEFIKKYPIFNTKLLMMIGNNVNQAAKKIFSLLETTKNAPSIISIASNSTSQFDQFQECNNIEEIISSNSSQLKKLIQHYTKLSSLQASVGKHLIKGLLNIKNSKRNIKDIFTQVRNQLGQQLKQIKVNFYENDKEIIRLNKGSFKDLSPGHRHTHNMNLEFKASDVVVYKKWREINMVFKELVYANSKQPKYLHICGGSSVGKTTFIQELGRIFVQRGMFEQGLYIIDGKQVQEKHESDFEAYIVKKNQTGAMCNLQVFNKYANENFLLMIDDFHLIKPRSNGRYNLFMKRLLEKRVNLIVVTHETYKSIQLKDIYQSVAFKTIKLEKLTEMELNIYAYNLFNLNNHALIQEYEQEKTHKKITLLQIKKLNEKYKTVNKGKYLSYETNLPEQNLKKIISNRN